MGYDISYHPINKEQLKDWYFDSLMDSVAGRWDSVEKKAFNLGLDRDDAEIYVRIMRVAGRQIRRNPLKKRMHIMPLLFRDYLESIIMFVDQHYLF